MDAQKEQIGNQWASWLDRKYRQLDREFADRLDSAKHFAKVEAFYGCYDETESIKLACAMAEIPLKSGNYLLKKRERRDNHRRQRA